MSTSYWLDKSSKTKKYDVVIIGGGLTGLSVAYWLQQVDASLKIAIVEKNKMGSGASGRNAGFVTCGSVEHFNRMVSKYGEALAVEIWKFSETNMNLLKKHIVSGQEEELEFEQEGTYSLAAEVAEFEELKLVARLMEKQGISVHLLEQKDVQAETGAQGFVGGIRYHFDGAIHPHKLLLAIRKKLKCDFFEGTEVYKIENNGEGTRQLLTDNGIFEASLAVCALNGYSSSLFNFFKNKVYPTRGQILVMEPVDRFMKAPCYANSYLDYFRQLKDGSLLIGGFRQLEKETEVGYSNHTTEVIQSALHSFVETHLPQFKNRKVLYRWAGVMGFSVDGEPMIGSLPNDPQVMFCVGFTGHGLGLGFHAAKMLVNQVMGSSVPGWLSARRFD